MAIPLIFAAAGIVARYIAKRGVQAAVKKFTKKAVTNGKKHLKDLKSKPTANQITNAPRTKGQRTYRAGQRNAFGVGVTGTATAAMLLSGGKEDKPTPRPKPKPKPKPPSTNLGMLAKVLGMDWKTKNMTEWVLMNYNIG